MKIKRHRPEAGPRFTIEAPTGSRLARHPGEALAVVEAQGEALTADEPTRVRVMDEDFCLYTVTRDELGHVANVARGEGGCVTQIVWHDPSPHGREPKFAPIVDMLRTQLGRWALLGTYKNRGGGGREILRKRGAEVTTRARDDGRYDWYARWPIA